MGLKSACAIPKPKVQPPLTVFRIKFFSTWFSYAFSFHVSINKLKDDIDMNSFQQTTGLHFISEWFLDSD